MAKQPCNNCPFRTDKYFPLSKFRRQEIAEGLMEDSDFPCHKTFEESDDGSTDYSKAKRCTGAAIFLENARPGGLKSNLSFRLAVWFKEIDLDKLDKNFPVAKTMKEFINAEI